MPTPRSRAGEEILSIIGILAAIGGVAVVWLIGSIRRPLPSVGRAWMVFVLGAVLVIAGIWLVRLRRWAGVLVALMAGSFALSWIVGVLRCGDCGTGVVLMNVFFALPLALSVAAIIRWRRCLK